MRPTPLIAAAAFLCLTAFTDNVGKFSVDFPEGWRAPEAKGILTSVTSSDGAMNCNAYAAASPGTAGLTRDQVNASFSNVMDAAAWAGVLGVRAAEIEVSETAVRPVGGAYLQIATILIHAGEKTQVEAKARIGIIAFPGYVLDAGC